MSSASDSANASNDTTALVFADEDQQRFALHSRDRNPMHVSALAARRTLTGRQVVHGIHTVMHALERARLSVGIGGRRIQCGFLHPVSVGDPVTFTQVDEADGRTRLLASVRGLVCTEIEIDADAGAPTAETAAWRIGAGEAPTLRTIGELADPLDDEPALQQGAIFDLQPWTDGLASEFPRAAALVGSSALTALARLSYFVGMVCPGMHSVFSSLQFRVTPGQGGQLQLRVRRWDPRFRLFTIDFRGELAGELRAFQRPRPQRQPTAAEVAALVPADEFQGLRALVVGGSRGLGETTAKIICAGGGQACVTHAAGRDDALRVAADVNGAGRGRCAVAPLDLSRPFAGVPGVDPTALNCVFYFATPQIYTKRRHVFSRQAFDEFVGFYLERFHELCMWLDGAPRSQTAVVYLPSTVFIDERPKGMTEYAMVKAAAEVLADDLDRGLERVRIVHSRLPRMATDQTTSILGVSTASNLDVLVNVVRQMSSAISSL
jgi:acyl dehydratase